MTLQELNKHFELREKLEKAHEMIDSLRSAAFPGGQKLDGMPHASGIKDKVGDLAIEIADMDARIEFLEEEIDKVKEPIIKYINAIDDDQTRLVFRLRFIRCLTWREVAVILSGGNTEDSVKKICYRYLQIDEE